MTVAPLVTVVVARRFSASAERVFDAWLDPGKAARFLFAAPTGQMVRAEIDARVGGSFTFVDRRNGEDIEHLGEYVEIVRPRRLVFIFWVPRFGKETSRVSIDIMPVGGGCELTLTHEQVPPEYATRSEAGWNEIIDGLVRTLE
jgi:uncharacterized protein YndB with AHSA1/START domain